MSKRRHRERSSESNNMFRNQGNGYGNRFPFGINPQQLMGLLGGNMDMNRLGSMLSSMNMDGFNLNSMNQQMGGMGNNQNGFNFNNMMNGMNNNMNPMDNASMDVDDINKDNKDNNSNSNINNKSSKGSKKKDLNINNEIIEDENIQMLISLRNIVDPGKADLVDKIIELYNKGAFKDN